MAFPSRDWLLILILSILTLEASGTYYPYGRATPLSGCVSLLTINSEYSASSSSVGPGTPVLHGADVWCSREINSHQYLTVDLGFRLWLDRLSVQGKANTKQSVTQYFVKTSTDNVNYQYIQEGGRTKVFWGPLFNGNDVVSTNLSSPVQARYVRFHPVEPLSLYANHLCMRVGVQSCQNVPDPVNGKWTNWSLYSACSQPCHGHKSRFRSCANPAPVFNGQPCTGHNQEDTRCSENCATDGGWSAWGAWSSCSQTCNRGSATRTRQCNNPAPAHGGRNCAGSASKTKNCLERYCAVDGGWSLWSSFSHCTLPCGGGVQTRFRLCSNPFPQHGGQSCPGNNIKQVSCNTQTCPVDGGWSSWGAWSNCPVTCGGGSQSRNRICNNPTPAHNGNPCSGGASETQHCNTRQCPVDGGWSLWSGWTLCSLSCDGQQSRYRSCNNPAPDHGGVPCVGVARQNGACNVGACPNPVDGMWAEWALWSSCSASCRPGGTRSRSRSCTNPSPSHGGHNCIGQPHLTEQCNTGACPVNGGFSPWTVWSSCSKPCGGGSRVRHRYCINPPPSINGTICVGDNLQSEYCNNQLCPVDGVWSHWSGWSPCDLPCGGGAQIRTRACDSPAPANNGQSCSGGSMESRSCQTQQCPVDGGWSAWNYTTCSVTCGQGRRNRTRSCTNPPPSGGGANCNGDDWQMLDCNFGPCPTTPPPTTAMPAITTAPPIPDLNITLIDLVFAISATSDNSFHTYNLMKNTIKQFIDKYGVDKIHYSVIVYGSDVLRVINFNHTFPPSANELKAAIDAHPRWSGGPVLKDALEETFRIFNETIGRPKALKVLVVITDKNSGTDRAILIEAVRKLEEDIAPKGVLVISVAIGAVNRSELLVISPNPLDVLSVDVNVNAGVLAERIMERILRLHTPKVDLGFALSATSVDSEPIFNLMKNIIKTIIYRYGVDKVRFSVVVFGRVVTTRFADFNKHLTQDGLIASVNAITPVLGPVNLGNAFREARLLFEDTSRPGAKRVFVLLTDALSSDSGNSLIVQTARLRREGVLILSVGFGRQFNQIGDQMNTVLFTRNDYIGVPNYPTERRVVIAEAIMFKALQANVPLIDLTFALSATAVSADSSFSLMKSTVVSIVQNYGIDRIHYSVIVFGSVATTPIDFSDTFPDRDGLIHRVSRLRRIDGSPDQVDVMQEAIRVFKSRDVRPNAKKVLVVILDNASVSNRRDLNEVVHVLVNKSVLIIGVGVGSSINATDLEIITEEIRNVITVVISKNPDELAEEIMAIILRTSGFSQWAQWSACSKTCRNLGVAGKRSRTRYCRVPGLGCVGPVAETRECNTAECQAAIPPSVGAVSSESDAGKGLLIALWILAGILSFLLLMACCYYCCWHVCCGRKKRRGLVYKGTTADDGGYLIEEDKKWRLAPVAMAARSRVPEDEVQEVTIEMTEENNKPSGVIQFGIEAEETKEKYVTAEDVTSEKPKYSEGVGTIKSGSSMMTMGSGDTGYRSTERRKRTKSETAASNGSSRAAEFSYKEEQKQGSDFNNEGFVRSQEYFAETSEPTPVHAQAQEIRRSQSADELAHVDYDMFENRRGSSQSQAMQMGRDGYMRMQQASRESMNRTDAGFAMGTVDVAIGGIRTPDSSRAGDEPIYDMPEHELAFMADNGGRNVNTLGNGGYRTEEWYTRGGHGPGQLREEGFKEIHVEHQPIYTEMTFGEEEFLHSRA